MAMFLKLTMAIDDTTAYVKAESIVMLRRMNGKTIVAFTGDDYTEVKETPEQIMQMIAQSAPRHWLDHPIDWHRPTWPQPPRETPREPQYGWGQPSVPSGPWSTLDWKPEEVTSFVQVADFLWPIGVDNPKKEETDEQS